MAGRNTPTSGVTDIFLGKPTLSLAKEHGAGAVIKTDQSLDDHVSLCHSTAGFVYTSLDQDFQTFPWSVDSIAAMTGPNWFVVIGLAI